MEVNTLSQQKGQVTARSGQGQHPERTRKRLCGADRDGESKTTGRTPAGTGCSPVARVRTVLLEGGKGPRPCSEWSHESQASPAGHLGFSQFVPNYGNTASCTLKNTSSNTIMACSPSSSTSSLTSETTPEALLHTGCLQHKTTGGSFPSLLSQTNHSPLP